MGNTSYDFNSRSIRTQQVYSKTSSYKEAFRQKTIHPSMDPKSIRLRESRDSDKNPNSFPIILAMDMTGSMDDIPYHFIKEGLPKTIEELKKAGIENPAVLFCGVGDSRCDNSPLQIGQFESGDAEMDMWMERLFIEGNGGGNNGESYSLPWLFAAAHCRTDSFDKRHVKGVIVTFGDEKIHKSMSASEIQGVMGYTSEEMEKYGFSNGVTVSELYERVSKQWEVFHINIRAHKDMKEDFRGVIGGERVLDCADYKQCPSMIVGVCKNVYKHRNSTEMETVTSDEAISETPKEEKQSGGWTL